MFVVNPSYLHKIMYYEKNYFDHADLSTTNRHMNYFLHYLALSVYPELLLPGKKAYMKAGLQARILVKAKRKEIAYHNEYYPKPYSYKTKETEKVTNWFNPVDYEIFWGLGFPVTTIRNYQMVIEGNLFYGFSQMTKKDFSDLRFNNCFGVQLLFVIQYIY
jgi:hypothetical protein